MSVLPRDDRDRLLLRIPEAAWRVGLSRSTLYEQIAAGELATVRVGRSVRIRAADLEAWVDRLQRQAGEEA